jgi:hypothetical protein
LTPDNANVLYSPDGTSWTEEDNQPIYVLDARINGSEVYDGNPYAAATGWVIYGARHASEVFQISDPVSGNSKHIYGFYAYVRAPSGTPGDDLYYELWLEGEGALLRSGLLADNTSVGSDWTWVSVTFPRLLLINGQTYRLVLNSPGSNSTTPYSWMAPNTELTSEAYLQATYDATNSYASYSIDSGNTWGENLHRDVIFRFITASGYRENGWLESSVFDAENVVTWERVSWTQTSSSGTSTRVYLRTSGNDNDPYDGTENWSSWTEVTNGQSLDWENRYIQYRVEENTTNENTTPVFQSINIAYSTEPVPLEAPKGTTIQTWIQTTQEDFLGGREPKDTGNNVQIIAPGDVVLEAAGYWGNEFYGTSSSTSRTDINNPNKVISMRFVAQENENLVNVWIGAYWNKDDTDDVPTDVYWRLQIRTDNDGKPSDNVIGENSLLKIGRIRPWVLMSYGFRYGYKATKATLVPSLPLENKLEAGKTYHIVISLASGTVNSENYITFITLDPRHADNTWLGYSATNENRNVLFSEDGGLSWEVIDREPVYVLDADRNFDGVIDAYEGNPHRKAGVGLFLGPYPGYMGPGHGQHVLVSPDLSGEDTNAAAIEFLVQKVGDPHDVHAGMGDFLETTLQSPIDVSEVGYNWMRVTLPAPRQIWENDEYDIYLKSPWSDISGYLETLLMKSLSYVDETATYGGKGSYSRFSYTGETWYSDLKFDLPFRFVTGYRGSGTFESKRFDAGQVVDWQYIEWDATEPPGTRIEIDVEAGGVTLANVTNGAILTGLPNSRYIQYRARLITNSENRGPALHEVRIGYRGGLGSLRLETKTRYYPSQTWVYEGGGVILKQDDTSIMYSPPNDLITVTDAGVPGDNLRVEVNLRMLKNIAGVSQAMATADSFTIHMAEEPGYTVFPAGGPNEDSVELVILSDYTQAWREYLQELSRKINRDYGEGVSSVDDSKIDEGEIKLIVNGRGPAGVRDIYYYENITEYEVS